MAREQPTTVYTEVQIDEDSISLTLISESGSNGPVIEDTERFTFDELQSLSGEHDTLRLSDESRSAMVEGRREALKAELLSTEPDSPNLPEVGDCLSDQNPPTWADDDAYLEVVEVLANTHLDEYVIEELMFEPDKTVADANPSYDVDQPVVIAQYNGSGDEYAFPASRLA